MVVVLKREVLEMKTGCEDYLGGPSGRESFSSGYRIGPVEPFAVSARQGHIHYAMQLHKGTSLAGQPKLNSYSARCVYRVITACVCIGQNRLRFGTASIHISEVAISTSLCSNLGQPYFFTVGFNKAV